MEINLYNVDCMEFMAKCEDNAYDLAIIDPPYGLGKRTTDGGTKKNTQTKFMDDIRRSNWDDNTPNKLYFSELFRISNNQIIWGGNYFNLHSYRTFIVWDKMNGDNIFADFELAYSSFNLRARIYKRCTDKLNRFHPTQKPVALYKWLLHNYAKEGDKIIDTHGGSGSILLACHDYKYSIDWMEIDKEYFDAAKKRYENHIKQTKLF